MTNPEPLQHGKYYHIYNRGINSCKLFKDESNYQYFLNLYEKHINPIADTFAWVLMPNHFHFLLRIKTKEEVDQEIIKNLHQYFSNLFNAYTKAFNKYDKRHGALFERPFHRKLINNQTQLQNILLYIHNNPIHHGYCEHPIEYGWSSYISFTCNKPTKLKREFAMSWFQNKNQFMEQHKESLDIENINNWLKI